MGLIFRRDKTLLYKSVTHGIKTSDIISNRFPECNMWLQNEVKYYIKTSTFKIKVSALYKFLLRYLILQ